MDQEPQSLSVKTTDPPKPAPKPSSPAHDWLKSHTNLIGLAAFAGSVALLLWGHFHPSMPPNPPAPVAPISLPAEAKVMVGKHVCLKALTQGKHVRWQVSGPQADVDLLKTDEKTAHFVAALPGDYQVKAETVINEEILGPAVCTIHVSPYAPPGPGPGPTPPGPGPTPSDPLTQALQTAYTADAAPDKAASLGLLQQVWAQSVTLADDPALKTAGDLLTTMHGAAQALLQDRLQSVRKAVEAEVNKVLAVSPSTPLDATLRAKCRQEFQKVSDALKGVK